MNVVGDKFPEGTGALAKTENLQTVHDGDLGLWERPAMVAPMAFLRYIRELSLARATHSDNDVFVSIVDSGGEANRTMTLAAGESMIAGRHTQCDLQISHRNVALRQVAVHVGHASTALRPLVRVWDLHTGRSLTNEDGKKIEALASDGPVFLSLGRYHLAIIPLGQLPRTLPVSTREAWASLPQRNFISAMAEGSGTRLLPEKLGGVSGTSSITRMPSSVTLDDIERTPVSPEHRIGTLVVQSLDSRLKFHVGMEHLERGILFGRYGRCLGKGFDRRVSRVHLLLASVGGEIVAIDTASTVGSKVDEVGIKSARLTGETKIRLGKHSYLIWRPREIPSS
jgi:hypothetical protein